jgi:hypothetical protein
MVENQEAFWIAVGRSLRLYQRRHRAHRPYLAEDAAVLFR